MKRARKKETASEEKEKGQRKAEAKYLNPVGLLQTISPTFITLTVSNGKGEAAR